MIKLETIEHVESFLSENPQSMIFKHSTTCPVSAGALRELTSFISDNLTPVGIILVIESRPLSKYVAKLTGVAHQSPQLLMFCKDKCCDSLSHYLITANRIKKVGKREC